MNEAMIKGMSLDEMERINDDENHYVTELIRRLREVDQEICDDRITGVVNGRIYNGN